MTRQFQTIIAIEIIEQIAMSTPVLSHQIPFGCSHTAPQHFQAEHFLEILFYGI